MRKKAIGKILESDESKLQYSKRIWHIFIKRINVYFTNPINFYRMSFKNLSLYAFVICNYILSYDAFNL